VRLLEAVIDANHRAIAGDQSAGLHPADFESELPIVALTCIDVRLNPLIPEVLGIPESKFIWLRNAGNIITSPLSSTMRSLALACAVKGGKEIVIIGHTDCQVCKLTTMDLLERFKALGIERSSLPANVNEYFGMFASERANIIKGAEITRHSPLIGPKIPVHGLLVDIQTGKLEWLVNGYQAQPSAGARWNEAVDAASHTVDSLKSLTDFEIGGIRFPETKIGEAVTKAEDWLSGKVHQLEAKPQPAEPAGKPPIPPRIPVATPLRPKLRFHKGNK
jgi:carbonic anhydrase